MNIGERDRNVSISFIIIPCWLAHISNSIVISVRKGKLYWLFLTRNLLLNFPWYYHKLKWNIKGIENQITIPNVETKWQIYLTKSFYIVRVFFVWISLRFWLVEKKRLKRCELLSYLTAVLNIFSINPYFTISYWKCQKLWKGNSI